MRSSKWVFLGAGVVAGLAAFFGWGGGRAYATDADGDGRDQAATWVTDPTGGYLSVTVATTNSADWGVELEVQDSNQRTVRYTHSESYNGAAGGTDTIADDLPTYASGSTFTVIARYYDSNHMLLDTERIPFTRP